MWIADCNHERKSQFKNQIRSVSVTLTDVYSIKLEWFPINISMWTSCLRNDKNWNFIDCAPLASKNIFVYKFPRKETNHERNNDCDDGKSAEIIIVFVDQTHIGRRTIRLGWCECSFGDLLVDVRGSCAGRMPLFLRIEQNTNHREFGDGCNSHSHRFA